MTLLPGANGLGHAAAPHHAVRSEGVPAEPRGERARAQGRAVQVHPIKPTLKAPGTKRLKLEYDVLLSNFAFRFNMRRYSKGLKMLINRQLGEGWNHWKNLLEQKRGNEDKVGPCMSTLSNPS
jgi:hypothetical protein